MTDYLEEGLRRAESEIHNLHAAFLAIIKNGGVTQAPPPSSSTDAPPFSSRRREG